MKNLSSPITFITKSIKIFFKKENFFYFLKIYGILLPFAVFLFYENKTLNFSSSDLSLSGVTAIFTRYGWPIGAVILVNLAYFVVSFWINAAGIKAVANATAGGVLGIQNTLEFAWKKLWKFSLLSILVGLIVAFGFIVLIIPGVIFLVWFRFASFEFMTKEVGVGEAISGSKRLAKGHFWQIFWRIVAFAFFGIIVQVILSIIPMKLGSVIQPLFGALFILPYFLLYKELSGE